MKIADLFVKLGLNSKDFTQGLNNSERRMSGFGGKVKKIGGLLASTFAASKLISFGRSAVESYGIQEAAERQLLVALKGREDVQQRLIKQAQKLQGETIFGDEETIKAQSLIAAFVKEEDHIKTIIPLVQDLAAAKSMNLANAADLVAKTLGSSTNALARYGIEVEGAVGSTQRLTSLQKGLQNAFGGQAAAAAETSMGAIKQFNNALGDLKETIGEVIVDSLKLVDVLHGLTGFTEIIGSKELSFWDKFRVLTGSGAEGVRRTALAYIKMKVEADNANEVLEEGRKNRQKDIDLLNATNVIVQKQVGYQEALKIAINESEEALRKFLDKSGKFAGEESVEDYISKIEELKNKIDDLKTKLEELQNIKVDLIDPTDFDSDFGGIFEDIEQQTLTISPDIEIDFDKEQFSAITDFLAEEEEKMKIWENTMEQMAARVGAGVSNLLQNIASGVGEVIAGGDIQDLGKGVLESIGKFMQQLGALMIAYAVHMALFAESAKNPLAWPVALAAGTAMVAAGAAISSFASKGLGGGSSPSYSTAASGYSPQASNAAEIFNGNVTFELEGDKLRGVLDNTQNRNQLMR